MSELKFSENVRKFIGLPKKEVVGSGMEFSVIKGTEAFFGSSPMETNLWKRKFGEKKAIVFNDRKLEKNVLSRCAVALSINEKGEIRARKELGQRRDESGSNQVYVWYLDRVDYGRKELRTELTEEQWKGVYTGDGWKTGDVINPTPPNITIMTARGMVLLNWAGGGGDEVKYRAEFYPGDEKTDYLTGGKRMTMSSWKKFRAQGLTGRK